MTKSIFTTLFLNYEHKPRMLRNMILNCLDMLGNMCILKVLSYMNVYTHKISRIPFFGKVIALEITSSLLLWTMVLINPSLLFYFLVVIVFSFVLTEMQTHCIQLQYWYFQSKTCHLTFLLAVPFFHSEIWLTQQPIYLLAESCSIYKILSFFLSSKKA